MQKLILLPILVIICLQGNGQITPLWQKSYKPKVGNLNHCKIVDLGEQGFAIFGQSLKNKIHFALLDNEGQLRREAIYDFPKAQFSAVLHLPDQGFIMVGYIIKNKLKYPAIWEMKKGGSTPTLLKEIIPKIPGQFNDISTNPSIVITGAMNNKMCLIRLNQNLAIIDSIYYFNPVSAVEKGQKDEVINSITYSEGNALAFDNFGEIYVTGHIKKANQTQFGVWKFLKDGVLHRFETDDFNKGSKGIDICVMDNTEIMAIGTSEDSLGNKNIYLSKMRWSLTIDTSRVFVTPATEEPVSILQLPSQEMLIAGQYTSFNSRTGDFWLNKIGRQYGDTLSPILTGKGQTEKACHALTLENGDYVISGILQGNKISLLYFKGKENPCNNELPSNKQVDFFPFQSTDFVLGKQRYDYKGYIVSSKPLSIVDIAIQREDIQGQKLPEQLILSEDLGSTIEEQYCYLVEKKIKLDTTNRIIVRIGNPKTIYEQKQDIFAIYKRPKLFVHSIGIFYPDLKFTTLDAKDFADIYREQEGLLFEQAKVTLLNRPESTTANSVSRSFQVLKEAAASGKIQPEDVLMVFISAHGVVKSPPSNSTDLNQDSVLFIPGSDYTEDFQRTLVNFEQEILGSLAQINCKKVVFLDACHSALGQKNGESGPSVAPYIRKISNTVPGTIIFYSSTANQLSYETDSLQNGLFTAAIINGFRQRHQSLDLDQNSIVTVKEMGEFLEKEVPALIKRFYPDKEQVPGWTKDKSIPDDFPIFYIHPNAVKASAYENNR